MTTYYLLCGQWDPTHAVPDNPIDQFGDNGYIRQPTATYCTFRLRNDPLADPRAYINTDYDTTTRTARRLAYCDTHGTEPIGAYLRYNTPHRHYMTKFYEIWRWTNTPAHNIPGFVQRFPRLEGRTIGYYTHRGPAPITLHSRW